VAVGHGADPDRALIIERRTSIYRGQRNGFGHYRAARPPKYTVPLSTILPRAPRLTAAAIADADHHQAEIIARLRTMREDHLADRLQRCQDARRQRQPGSWPWRCGSAGCWSCRRTTVRKWWRGFLGWHSGPGVSLVTIPLTATTDVISTLRRVRKGLRDVRDRLARTDPVWGSVAMAGMLNGDHLLMVVQHVGNDRDTLWTVLDRRWPEAIVSKFETVEPRSELSVETTVQLAVQGRGIEPIRIVIPAQVKVGAPANEWDEPMPVLV